MSTSILSNQPSEHICTVKLTDQGLFYFILRDKHIETEEVKIGEAADVLPTFVEQVRVLANAKLILKCDETYKTEDLKCLPKVQSQIHLKIARADLKSKITYF